MGRGSTIATLEERLGHRFADRALLERALTHSSTGIERDYERLEFLGDRVLGLVVAELLLERFPEESEGEIGRRFASLVRAEVLTEVGEALGLPGRLQAEAGSMTDGMVADATEAVIAALYRDGGLAVAADFVRRNWAPLIEKRLHPPRDSKTTLQEWSQSRGMGLPRYTNVGRAGPDHAPTFTVAVTVEGGGTAEAPGQSKRAAEQAAAALLLDRLGIDHDE